MTGLTLFILAQAAASSNAMTYGQWLMNAAMIAWSTWLTNRVKSSEAIKAENKKQASDLIKTEIASVEQKLIARMDLLNLSIQSFSDRLKDGDHKFDSHAEQDKRLEMKLLAMSNDLKDYIRETCADPRRVEKLENQLIALQRQVDQQKGGQA